MKAYCRKCGAKIEFSVKSKPKFCHGCGKTLSLGPDRSTALSKENADDEDTEDFLTKIPNISSLDIDITPHVIRGEKIGSIAGTASSAPSDFQRETETLSRKEFREQFQREAGTLRDSDNPTRTNEE